MDAKAKSVREILHSGDQFLVPFFQRYYSWQRRQWSRLRDDLWALIDDVGRKQHFLGPLVCTALNPAPGEITAFQLIDGQQRMATLSLLLAAVRDVAVTSGEQELAAEITETFLIHRFRKGSQRYKIVPRVGDREAFVALMEAKPVDAFHDRHLVNAYHYFRKSVQSDTFEKPQRLRQIFEATVNKLYLVVVTIGEENPYEIFESLNSTGLRLEESDLVRNFVFMQLPFDEQADFQTEHWQAFEAMFEATGKFPEISATAFYRDFLMQRGDYVRAGSTFVDFKRLYQEEQQSPTTVVARLTHFAELYLALMRGGDGQSTSVRTQLSRFTLLDANTANPLLLALQDRLHAGSLSETDFVGCVEDITSFIIRRSICGETARGYGRWFCEAIQQLGTNTRESLQAYLLHRGWPDDQAFVQQLMEFPIYRREFKKCRLILQALEESYGHKEKIDLSTLQIEHILPQKLPRGKSGAQWRAMLGEEAVKIHKRVLHTIGNLTLTGYNPKLSNKSFEQKRVEFLNSKLSLNKCFQEQESWNDDAIQNRAAHLAQRVAKLWPRPAADIVYRPQVSKSSRSPNAGRERREAYWAKFLERLAFQASPWLPLQSTHGTVLELPLAAHDVTLRIHFYLPKRQFNVRLQFERHRGKQMYLALLREREAIDAEFIEKPKWKSGNEPEVSVALSGVTIRDSLDWLEQHEWLAARIGEFHRAFYERLKELDRQIKEKNPHKQMLFEYWIAVHDLLKERGSTLSGIKPLPQHWNDFAIGRSHFWLQASCNNKEQRIAVKLGMGGPHADDHYKQLLAQRTQIEDQLHTDLEWLSFSGKKQRYICLYKKDVDPSSRDDWHAQHRWLIDNLERFHEVFQPLIRNLTSIDTHEHR
jgi:hypothetical protein